MKSKWTKKCTFSIFGSSGTFLSAKRSPSHYFLFSGCTGKDIIKMGC